MTKTLWFVLAVTKIITSLLILKNYIFLKLIRYFIDIRWKNEISMNLLFTKWKWIRIRIGFWTLTLKSIQWILWTIQPSRMQVQLLLEVGQDRQPHSISFKIIEIFLKAIHLYPPLVAVKPAEISGLTSKTARKILIILKESIEHSFN